MASSLITIERKVKGSDPCRNPSLTETLCSRRYSPSAAVVMVIEVVLVDVEVALAVLEVELVVEVLVLVEVALDVEDVVLVVDVVLVGDIVGVDVLHQNMRKM